MGGLSGVILNESSSQIVKDLIEILKREEYLGDDGTGLAIVGDTAFFLERYPVQMREFINIAKLEGIEGKVGIGEVRFATHGRPSLENTPPLFDCKKEIYVVMEGIVAKYEAYRKALLEKGHIFSSRNDTEIFAHVLEEEYDETGDYIQSVIKTASRIDGHYATIILHKRHPNNLAVISRSTKIFVGIKENRAYIASELEALIGLADKYTSIEDAVAIISPTAMTLYQFNGDIKDFKYLAMPEKITHRVPGGFNYFMEREIFETPKALKRALIVHQNYYLELIARMLIKADKVYFIGAGTSYHAALLGGYILSDLCDISPIVIDSTEFPYYGLKDVTPGTIVVAFSQSGKSTDVIRAVSKAKMYGASIIGITNKLGSPLMFASNLYLPLGVGPERAVPATKSFLGQLLAIYKIAIKAAEFLNTIRKEETNRIWSEMNKLPEIIERTIQSVSSKTRDIASKIYQRQSMFVSSRGLNYPVALEGALKIKEASYIHAEGIEAGMLRHGPKAIIEKGFPVITVMPYEKDAREDTYNLLDELISLGAQPIIITDEADKTAEKITEYVIKVPKIHHLFTPFANIIPLQLLAFYLGLKRGSPIDAPRGLSKYVVLREF